jgi:hypothetical protein
MTPNRVHRPDTIALALQIAAQLCPAFCVSAARGDLPMRSTSYSAPTTFVGVGRSDRHRSPLEQRQA